MKLIYLCNQRLPTDKAYGIQIAKMCEALSLQGADIELVIPSRRNPIEKGIFDYYGVKSNFRVTKLSSPDFYLPGKLDKATFVVKNFLSAIRLGVYALSHSADVIFSRDELPLYFLSFFKKNLVFEIHKFSSKRVIFYKRFRKTGMKVVAISGGLRDELVRLGISENKILVAHDGVDLDKFIITESKQQCREELGLPQDKKIIGYIGQLKTMGMEKGIKELILAVGALWYSHPDLLLVIVGGNDSDKTEYEFFVEEKGLKDVVLFAGRKAHKDIPVYLKACDVLAMPFPNIEHYASHMSPLKLFEYMASGRPIVATDLPVIREILNERNSVLINSADKNALADGIKLVLEDGNFAKKVSQNSLQDIESFSWHKRASHILRFVAS